ncbi:MAG: tetratricopeptide repeat protein [Myxococcaceae bacterium]|nr:tetratricopeptide repeat protein [Myxococcaceae bacterium]
MTSYKAKQKELRAPDALQQMGVEAMPWIQAHQQKIAAVVFAAVAVAGVVALVSHFGDRSEKDASTELAEALKPLGRPVQVGVTPPPTEPGAEPPFKSETERDEALVASLTAFRTKYPSKKAAANAALPLAQALARLGRTAETLPLLEEFLKAAAPNDPLRFVALEAKGYAYEAKQQWGDALGAFEELGRSANGDFMKGMGQYHKGRLLVLQGKPEEGAKELSEVIASAPGTAAGRLATERVALLSAQGIKVPAAGGAKAPGGAADGG